MPDGKSIVVSFGGKINRVEIATGETRGIPFTAKVSQQLGPLLNFPARVEQGPVRARLIQAPAQSPDGKQLAFSSLTRLYTKQIPGGKPERATAGDAREYQPTWSPDGQWLAYVTWSPEGGHIWKVRAGGTEPPRQLTSLPAFYRDPAWTADGSQIVALRAARQQRLEGLMAFGPPPGLDLISIPAGGGDAKLIVPARGVRQPHFTTEKDRVYVYSAQGLISMRF